MASLAGLARPEAAPAPGTTPRGRMADPRRTSWPMLAIFVLPALAVYGGLTAYPAFRTIYDSFFTIEGMERVPVGLATSSSGSAASGASRRSRSTGRSIS